MDEREQEKQEAADAPSVGETVASKSPMSTGERIAWIDNASYEQLLALWRHEPSGSPWFADGVGEHFARVMETKRNADPAAAVRASKDLGW